MQRLMKGRFLKLIKFSILMHSSDTVDTTIDTVDIPKLPVQPTQPIQRSMIGDLLKNKTCIHYIDTVYPTLPTLPTQPMQPMQPIQRSMIGYLLKNMHTSMLHQIST